MNALQWLRSSIIIFILIVSACGRQNNKDEKKHTAETAVAINTANENEQGTKGSATDIGNPDIEQLEIIPQSMPTDTTHVFSTLQLQLSETASLVREKKPKISLEKGSLEVTQARMNLLGIRMTERLRLHARTLLLYKKLVALEITLRLKLNDAPRIQTLYQLQPRLLKTIVASPLSGSLQSDLQLRRRISYTIAANNREKITSLQQHIQRFMDEKDRLNRISQTVILDLLNHSTTPKLEPFKVIDGTYHRIDLMIGTHMPKELPLNVNDPDGLIGNSIYIEGIYTPDAADANAKNVILAYPSTDFISLLSQQGFNIQATGANDFILDFDSASWFRGFDFSNAKQKGQSILINRFSNRSLLRKFRANLKQRIRMRTVKNPEQWVAEGSDANDSINFDDSE